MNYTVSIGGVDCAGQVISISRDHSLCGATATAEVELDPTWGQAFSPYDEMVIHEEGTKVFTGYVTPVEKQRMQPERRIMAQCPTKKLQDWWYVDEVGSAGSSPAQMIAMLCDDAGVSYSLNSTTTEVLPSGDDEKTWRYTSAWDIMEELLTMMGWQLIADADGVLQIGAIALGTPTHTFQEGVNLISVGRHRSDSYYRNAIAVYGSSGINVKTSWVQDGELELAGAFANPLIYSESLATSISIRALLEFNRNLDVKTCEIIGDPTVVVGNTATVIESFTDLNNVCLVTTVRSNMDRRGYITEAVLDERCPVIWGHGVAPRLLYAATAGSGVYVSDDYGETWEAANGTGGSALTGNALNVYAVEASSTNPYDVWAGTADGLYRTPNGGGTWEWQDLGGILLTISGGSVTVSPGSPIVVAVDQDELNPERVYFLAKLYTSGSVSNWYQGWVVSYSSGSWNNWQIRWM